MASWSSRPLHRERGKLPVLLWFTGAISCADAEEARRVELAVVVDGTCVEPVTTNLGYMVQVQEAQLAVSDLQFSIAGEVLSHMGNY